MVLQSDTFVSVAEAAELIGCTTGRIRQLLGKNLLEGTKLNERAWAVRLESATKYAESERHPGPKRKAS